MKKYDLLVYIGRFQPLHQAHIDTINTALELSEQVLVLVGSSFNTRSINNPFTFEERKEMIFNNIVSEKLTLAPLRDYRYDDLKWIENVEYAIKPFVTTDSKIGIIGHAKDESSWHLNAFPQFELVELGALQQNMNATAIREAIYNDVEFTGVSEQTLAVIKDVDLSDVIHDYRFMIEYKKPYKNLPFPPIFITTGVIVTACDHILMITRGSDVGIGQLALPGGFVDAAADESVYNGAIRELYEEAGIPSTIDGCNISSWLIDEHMFDQLGRSSRGRMITHVYHFDLDEMVELKAGDDAMKAEWIKISDLDSSKIHSDHYSIIDYFLDLE